MSLFPALRRFLVSAALTATSVIVPRIAQAYSLTGQIEESGSSARFSVAGGHGGRAPLVLQAESFEFAQDRLEMPDSRVLRLAQTEAVSAGEPSPMAPAFERPHPTFGQYCRDTAVLTVVVFAWKRALNATAARRMFKDHYQSEHFTTTPFINDGNNWVTNWVSHPLVGMWYYQYFRSFGHSRLASGFGSFFVSTVHEYLIETSFEPASGIDIIMTPGLGVPMGILTDEVSVDWARSDSKVKRFSAYLMNPFLAMPWARWRRDIRFDPRSDRFEFTLGWDF